MKRFTILLILVCMLFALAGCSGATFVRNPAPVHAGTRVGILIPSYQLSARGAFDLKPFAPAIQARASELMVKDLETQFQARGFTAKLLVPSTQVTAAVERYKALPRNFRKVISKPEAAHLGDLKSVFKRNDVDRIILLEGESIVPSSALRTFAVSTASLAASLAMHSVIPFSGAKPTTVTYVSEVNPDGTLSYYNREQFTRAGNFLDSSERAKIAQHAVDGWLDATPK